MRGIATKTLKIKRENGEEFMLLDTPTDYLCGPWFTFHCQDKFYVFKNYDKENPYKFVNVKSGKRVNRFTVEYQKTLNNRNDDIAEETDYPEIKARFFMDVYYSTNDLNCVFFYSIQNNCTLTFKNVHLFNLFDFDIGGLEHYSTNFAFFDPKYNAIVQHDGRVHVGFCSLENFPAVHYSAGHPYEIKIDVTSSSLNDTILKGPDDFFSGLEWDLGSIDPGQQVILPVVLAAGESKEEFYDFLRDGITKARKIFPSIPRVINAPERQKILKTVKMIEKMNPAQKDNDENEC